MKKILITIIFLLNVFITAQAAEYKSDVVVSLQINNPIMEVNGEETQIDMGRNTSPVISDGRTLVPIRAIIEAFGGQVEWDETTQSVLLTMGKDTIKLTINNNVAYLNNNKFELDVSPTIINERTMLPIRFVAEGFNLGVAWDGKTQVVSIIRNLFETHEYEYLQNTVPEYSGQPYVYVNENVPMFEEYEIISGSFEYYSNLDELGRCDVCMASVAEDIMPTEERQSISSVIPTGWQNATYEVVEGGYLYNRCHLIGFQLTGENANDKNLITGTRYMNIEGMLAFENMVDDYIEQTGNHVMYRATPVFEGNNLVADGVLIEAYSVEDGGKGISFCVYCYNVQPGVDIDYATGYNKAAYTNNSTTDNVVNPGVYRTPTGKRYHFDPDCGGKNSFEITLDIAINAGLTPCLKCAS